MIDLNKYYIAKKYTGPSGGYPAAGGFVPPAASGDSSKFLRGDGSWAEVNIPSGTPLTVMSGAASGTDGQEGFVPKPVAGDNRYFLRGDGAWSDPTITRIQFIDGTGLVTLDVENYDTFVINTNISNQFTYSGFEIGKSINVYISGLSSGYIHHVFPENTFFSELGDDNIIYSFSGYATRILLQNIGQQVINFSSIVPVSSASVPYYYTDELDLTVGIGTILLDEFINNLI